MPEPNDLLVVCTRDRPEQLVRLLVTVAASIEVPSVIVVDASRDTERSVQMEWKVKQLPIDVRVVRCEPGLTYQRNVGLRMTSAQIVHMLDDDVEVEPGYFAALRERLEDRSVVGAGGLELGRAPAPVTRLARFFLLGGTTPGSVRRSGVPTPVFTTDRAVDVDWLPGCSMSYRLDGLDSLRFDERPKGYPRGDDLDFSTRARRLGRLLVDPAARYTHHHDGEGRSTGAERTANGLAHRYLRIHDHGTKADRPCFWWSVMGMVVLTLVEEGIGPESQERMRGIAQGAARACAYSQSKSREKI